MKILLAEDDAALRLMVEAALKRWGYECISAKDGLDAWDRFKSNDVDIVVTDWMMPGIDGMELCKRIRNTPQSRYVYMIFLTLLDSTDNVVMGIESGADDYVSKPFEPSELRARLKAGERIVRLERSLAMSNERMRQELQNAARNLEQLLPANRNLSPRIRFDWHFKPSIYIGGDIFNIIKLDEDHIGLFMIDVSGHGVSSALLATTLSNLLRPSVAHGGLLMNLAPDGSETLATPEQVAQKLNQRFPLDPAMGMFFTFFYGVLNERSHELHWLSAGHPRPLVLHGNQVITLEEGNPPIGLIDNYSFKDTKTLLEKGDRLILCSDGLLDIRNLDDEPFDNTRLVRLLEKHYEDDEASLVQKITATYQAFGEGRPPEDDISLLILRAD